jgi:hypothetical protein
VPARQQAQLQDPNINPQDTYLAFDAQITTNAVVSYSSPVIDPATGQQVTQIALPEAADINFRVEAGYDAAGKVRTNLNGQWSLALDSTVSLKPDAYRLLLSNGQLSEYSGGGALLATPPNPATNVPSPTNVLNVFGGDLLYGDILGGVLVDSIDVLASPPATTQLVRSSTALRVISPSSGAGGNGRIEKRYKQHGNKWLLEEIVASDSVDDGAVRWSTRSSIRLTGTQVFRNARLDSVRASLRDSLNAVAYNPTIEPGINRLPCQEDCDPPPPPPPATSATAPARKKYRVSARLLVRPTEFLA